jgi:hypothetical protein
VAEAGGSQSKAEQIKITGLYLKIKLNAEEMDVWIKW